MEKYLVIGRRKKARAKVRMKAGSGNITVNKKAIDDYFPRKVHSKIAREPLEK